MRLSATRRLQWLALALAGAAAVAAGAGALGRHAWWLELFTHFRPQYALALAGAGLALVLLRPRGVGFAALALAVAVALPVAERHAPRRVVEGGGTPFTAVLANVWYRNDGHARVLEFVRAEQPDFAVFLEVTPAWEAALAGLDGLLPYRARAGEVLVASRRPLGGLRAVPLSPGVLALSWSQGGLTIVGAHASWPLGPRVAAARREQFAALAALARGRDGPVLVLGDLNATAWSPDFADLRARGGLADCGAGQPFVPTWPALFPPAWIQIDHCLHGAGIAIDALRRGPWVGSDHFPLVVRGRLLPPPGASGAREARAGVAARG